MTVKEQIEKDIKTAMLAGEKQLVTTLRGLKSALLYAEVAAGARDQGLSDEAAITVLQKEAKKRQESVALFRQGNNEEKAAAEEAEYQVIQKYLPAQLSENEVSELVAAQAKQLGATSPAQMGQLIGAVKLASKGAADGALIARLAKEYLNK